MHDPSLYHSYTLGVQSIFFHLADTYCIHWRCRLMKTLFTAADFLLHRFAFSHFRENQRVMHLSVQVPLSESAAYNTSIFRR